MQIAVIGAADATPEEYDTAWAIRQSGTYTEMVFKPMVELVYHTDAERAHEIHLPIGKSDHALAEAQARGWTVVDMKKDWKTIFPPATR